MNRKGFRRWVGLGGLVTATLLGVGCGGLPESGGKQPDEPKMNVFKGPLRHVPETYYSDYQLSRYRGFNGTIADVGSSIDPRTPQKAGTLGRSRLEDVTGRPAPSTTLDQGIGGSGNAGRADSTSDMGWRARRGDEAPAFDDFGSYTLPFNP
ncbi:hypothetical protein POL68_31750 [Stigmatella sp. ncwal1]|uniref:Lipoprotein n=1 Tax=Stigmatella ashevillensis TaxID=2995309 RepID=A0ABT5DHD8_9BACT|nr:hypothetical protein [Stigmatella ashevillena]MDC0713080.1 hypothetical protein [Stigmatella ashevillena]